MKNFTRFEQHLYDLKRISPNAGDVFVCPICLKVIPRSKVDANSVNIGHVWPKYIRNNVSKKTKSQQVLLCKPCNSAAGSQGDSAMQKNEKIKRGEEPETITIYYKQGHKLKHITLRMHVEEINNNPLQIKLRTTCPAEAWNGKNNNCQTYGQIVQHKPMIHVVRTGFQGPVKIGWLTSAYLFAFYNLGYQYVLQSALDPVRDYIQRSFEEPSSSYCNTPTLSLKSCNSCDVQEPLISYYAAMDKSKGYSYLRIDLLNYHINIPFPIISSLNHSHIEELKENQLSSNEKPRLVIHHNEEESLRDLLCLPDYEVVGDRIERHVNN
jgi:uncharacterized C2H2 Zn-finger protein